MDCDVESLLNSGGVGMASRARRSLDAPYPILWLVERRRDAGPDLIGLLVTWAAITLATLALSRLFFPGW